MFSRNNDEEEENDFFTGPDIPDPVKEEKKPELKPDDPDYWDQEESEWEHLRPSHGRRAGVWWMIGAAVVAVALVLAWFKWFSPRVDDATQFGYVEKIEHRGLIFKTFEGVAIPYKEMMDTTRVYDRDFDFSVKDVKVATRIKEMMVAGQPVRLTYKVYRGALPWRGEQKIVVTAVDSADAKKILPPEFRPF